MELHNKIVILRFYFKTANIKFLTSNNIKNKHYDFYENP